MVQKMISSLMLYFIKLCILIPIIRYYEKGNKLFCSSLVTTHLMQRQHNYYCTTAKRKRKRSCSMKNNNNDENGITMPINESKIYLDESSTQNKHLQSSLSRRKIITQSILATAAASTILPSYASTELDKTSGELFTSKKQMLSGYGSDETRGIKIRNRQNDITSQSQQERILTKKKIGLIQNVYNERFVTYLSRFLLTFDPAAKAWWDNQKSARGEVKRSDEEQERKERIFADFAESVEVGLADYFLGPYGSYASVQAAKAGLYASNAATSTKEDTRKQSVINNIFSAKKSKTTKTKKKFDNAEKQGILNLFTLLQARYTTINEKIQIVILFSFISDQELQPVQSMSSLLGEIDDTVIEEIDLVPKQSLNVLGGYEEGDVPKIKVDSPQALGNQYKPTLVKPIMERSGRILRIEIKDPGEGYFYFQEETMSKKELSDKRILQKSKRQQNKLPTVTIMGKCTTPARAIPIVSREGEIEDVIILDPGSGYTDVPTIKISPPPKDKSNKRAKTVVAKATAKLEYKVSSVQIEQKGNGYIYDQLPNISITKPDTYMDWIIPEKLKDNDIKFKIQRVTSNEYYIPKNNTIPLSGFIINSFKKDITSLLPNTIRPKLINNAYYSIDDNVLPYTITLFQNKKNFYRAIDPLFGPISTLPVIKPAVSLSVSEYTRLAISGAICTVIVRTGLNPLELVKTKIQLKNDSELMNYVNDKDNNKAVSKKVDKKSQQPSTITMIKSLIELRGIKSLFQSADITFLASLVFGSFGFGATELFRRSFTLIYFEDSPSSVGFATEFIFLFAAALACILTSFVASPFETIRVKSMSYIDNKRWNDVFIDFIQEQRKDTDAKPKNANSSSVLSSTSFNMKDIQKQDIVPLFSAFPPIVSRELPFAIIKFLVFDLVAQFTTSLYNSYFIPEVKVQVGVGTLGLAISAFSGALAGIAGAIVSHPADLILTLTSAAKAAKNKNGNDAVIVDWREIVKGLLQKDGGILNLFVGLPARASFFFLVIGLQFFLYDYVKTLFQVGSDDLTLVLDVFYAVRQGLV